MYSNDFYTRAAGYVIDDQIFRTRDGAMSYLTRVGFDSDDAKCYCGRLYTEYRKRVAEAKRIRRAGKEAF